MGRRRSGGGGSGSGVKTPSIMDRVLTRDIENLKKNNNYATVEELVDHLRSAYPRYARHKLLPFTKCVNQIASSLGREEVRNDDSDSNDDNTLTKKKRRKIDPGEEKLRAIEAQHIKSRSGNVLHNSSASSSIASTASSGSSSEEDESSDKEASTSDDAIFGKKFKPEFDLMSSMLRQNYVLKSKNVSEPKEAQEALELEVVENKDQRKVSLVNEGAKQAGVGGNGLGEFSRNGNKNNGPLFKDLGGMGGVIEQLKREVVWPLYSLKVLRHLGVKPMAGVLLHGPPGCGKTKLAHALANETNVPFYKISATELVSGVSGASEENIRELFSKAYRTAPSIIFIDEIDAIASKRENVQREMERRIVTQLMTCMDESHRVVKPDDGNGDSESSDHNLGHVIVIGATNRPDAVDPALRRPGRFDREIMLGVPDERARVEILSVLVSGLKVEGAFDLLKIARSTPGFVGADLAELTNKAGNLAFNRILDEREAELSNKQVDKEDSEEWWKHPWSNEEMERLNITMADFEEAAKFVQPSSRREGFSTIPNVKWDDVGGLHLLRQEFERDIVRRIKYPEYYENVGVPLETGFLLYGPPGCGKTLIAKAVANEAGANFIHIKGPEILNKYVGESELAVRKIFSRARTCSPCILFFDEVDAITTMRGREGGWVVERLLTQLLIELDGAEQRRGVFVIGATNRPEVMDRAFLRPGRFGKLFYVPLPTPDERGMILKAVARKNPVDATVDLMAIAKDNACENLSGADLSNLMREAINVALDEEFTLSGGSLDGKSWTIKDVHFKRALEKISPSVSNEQIRFYQRLSQSFKAA